MKLMKYGKKLSLWLLPAILMSVLIVSWSFAADYSISVDSPSIDEGITPANLIFSITISPAVETGDEIQVTVSSSNGTAIAGPDFTGLASQNLIFTTGDTTRTVPIQILSDTAVEGNETFTLELSNVVFSADGGHSSTILTPDPADATGTIANDDTATFNIGTDVSQAENSGNAVFTISTSDTIEDSAEDIILNYSTATGTASASDFSGGGSVSFLGTDTSESINITIVNDTIIEGNEDYTVTLTGVTSGPALLGTNISGTGTIENDDNATFTIETDVSQTENSGNAVFTVSTSDTIEDSATDITLAYSTVTGTASATDFSGGGSVSFTGTDTSKPINITIVNDTIVEGDEDYTVTLTDVTNGPAQLGTNSSGTGTIENDDTATFNIGADVSQAENSGNAVFTVSTSDTIEDSAEDIILNYSTTIGTASAADFSAGGSSISFTGTGTSEPISITIVNDTIVEGDESYAVTLTSVANGPALLGAATTAIGTIENDHDTATLTLAPPVNQDESAGTAVFLVTSTADIEPSANVQVTVETTDGTATTADNDYTAIPPTVVLATYSGTPETIPVTVNDDNIVESDESFSLTLNTTHPDISIAPPSVDTTIINDDIPMLTVNNLAPVAEGADGSIGDATFTVTIDKAVATGITVNYDYRTVNVTTQDNDFANLTYSGTGFSGTGINASQNAVVRIQGDDIVERDETYRVEAYNGTITGTSVEPAYTDGTGTITNDDIPTISLITATTESSEGNSGTTTADYTVGSDLIVADDAEITFDYSITDTSTDGDDVTLGTFSASLSNGTETIVQAEVTGDQTVEGDETYTLTISNPAVTDSTVTILTGNTTGTGTIRNDDIPTLTVNDSSVYEGQGAATDPQFTITTDLAVAADTRVHVEWYVGDITTSDDDFATAPPLTGPAFFNNAAAGDTFNIPLLIAADNLEEHPDETYIIYLTGGTITDISDIPSDPDGLANVSDTGSGIIRNDDHEISLSTTPDAVDISNYSLRTTDGTGATVPPNSASTIVDRDFQPVFIAAPAAGNCYRIDDILVNGSSIGTDFFRFNDSTSHSYTFPPVTTEDQTIEAQFSDNYTIRTSIMDEAHGTITDSQTVSCATNDVIVEINAEERHSISWITLDGVEVTGVNGLKTHTFEFDDVRNDLEIIVAFSQLIDVTEISPFGTIYPAGNGDPIVQEIHYGENQNFTIDAVTCQLSDPEHHEATHQHHISRIIVDGAELTGIEGAGLTTYSHTFSNVTTSDHSIEALFTSFVEVSIEAGGGTVKTNDDVFIHTNTDTNPGFAEVEAGSIRFDITPDPGYYISQLEIDGEIKGFGQQWTFDDMSNGDHTLKVWFAVDTYTLDPISNFRTIFSDSTLTTQAITVSVQHPDNYTFYIKLEEPNNWDYSIEVDGFIVDGTQYDIPGNTDEYTHGTFTTQRSTINAGTATEISYLRLTFTSIDANHRLEVLDFENTPIADVPLDTRIRPQPAVIMFVLDDSGSMDWEFMTEESSGVFSGNYYLFDTSDNVYSYSTYGIISGNERREWKSQWANYNKMYYNPDVTYNPWPTFFDSNLEDADGDISDHIANADLETPRSHPYHSTPTMGMDAIWHGTYITVQNINKTIPEMAANTDHHQEAITVANNQSRIRVWTEYTGDSLDTMLRILDSNGDEYRWEEYQGHQAYDGGNYDDDSGSGYNSYIELAGVPSGNYTFDIVSYNGGSSGSFNLFYEVAEPDSTGKTIFIAHYYAKAENDQVYLVNIVNPVEYYTVNVGTSNTYQVQDNDLTRITDLTTIPDEIVYYDPNNFQASPSSADLTEVYERERQNFVNWFSYYRKRELAATAAIATFIQKVDNVKIGFKFINDRVPPLAPRPVEVVENMQVQNERAAILHNLYSMVLTSNGTPLRNGLDDVGEYFADDTDHSGTIGISPFADGEDGSDCKQVFAIVMTDGYWNGSNHTGIGNRDGDGFSTSLADVARYYYDHDLSDLDDNVPEFIVPGLIANPKQFQHMTTYTVGFGVEGNISSTEGPYDYDSSSWGSNKIDDLWHAAVNGGGKYYNASRPDKLVESLLFIMEDIMGGRVGGGASVSINGDELYETIGNEIRIYQASYDTDYWSGDIRSFRFDVDGDDHLIQPLQRSENWSAQDRLLSLNDSNARTIVTYNSTTSTGVELKYTNLTTEQKKYVIPYFFNPGFNITYPVGTDIVVDFLRGSRLLAWGGLFRERLKGHAIWNNTTQKVETDFDNLEEAWLGDFVNSRPVFHDDVIYAGSNDGMLHAFDGATGNEIFAYMPNLVFDHVRELADPTYTHKFYVDSTPVIATVDNGDSYLIGGLGKGGKGYYCLKITDANTVTTVAEAAALVTNGWEYPPPVSSSDTVSGANRFLFTAGIGTDGADRIEDSSSGLAIFDSTAFITIIGANDITRELTNDGTYEVIAVAVDGSWLDVKGGSLVSGAGNLDDVIIRKSISDTDMGYSFGKPVIIKTNDLDLGYVAIVGNGYASESRTASLKIISLEGGGGFNKGELITTLQTGRTTLIKNNGLSTPKATDVDNDLLVDYVYAGDLAGNMWKFDLTDSNFSNWQIAYCDNGTSTDHCLASTAVTQPLFTTAGQQPITAAPDIMFHQSYNGYMVIFGTGRYLMLSDLDNTYSQSLYGIWDWAPDNIDTGYLGARIDNQSTTPNEVELTNWTTTDVGGARQYTLLRQIIWCEGAITAGSPALTDYYRIASNYEGDWELVPGNELDFSHHLYNVDAMVPTSNLGWVFDLPGKITASGGIEQTFTCNASTLATADRDLGERVTSDTIIRDGHAILISYMKEGDRCTGGLYSFLNERDADTGGMPYAPIFDVNNDGEVDDNDRREINIDFNEDGVIDVIDGNPSDRGGEGRFFNPVILRDEDDDNDTSKEEETKFIASSTGEIIEVVEPAEKRGVYHWQQVE